MAEEELERLRRESEPDPGDVFEVHDDCWPSFEVFLAADTQWRVGPGGPVGLDYQGVLAAMRFLGRRPTKELLMDLKAIEHAALAAMRERQENE